MFSLFVPKMDGKNENESEGCRMLRAENLILRGQIGDLIKEKLNLRLQLRIEDLTHTRQCV